MAIDVNADVYAELDITIERIGALIAEGNSEGAKELAEEAEGMIVSLKGKSKAVVDARMRYREAIRERLLTPAPSAELVHVPQSIEEVEGLDQLIELGAKAVYEVAEQKYTGARKIAEIIFDMRRRIVTSDGMPDLKGTGDLAKQASAQVYDRVRAQLPAAGEDEIADGVRADIDRIQDSVRDSILDLRVNYLRSLDSNETEAALYRRAINTGIDVPVSEQVAAHYKINKLMTRAELAAERRELAAKRKAELTAKNETDELSEAEAAELNGEKYVAPADVVKKLPSQIGKLAAPIDAITDGEWAELRSSLTDKEKAKIIQSLRDEVARLQAVLAELA